MLSRVIPKGNSEGTFQSVNQILSGIDVNEVINELVYVEFILVVELFIYVIVEKNAQQEKRERRKCDQSIQLRPTVRLLLIPTPT